MRLLGYFFILVYSLLHWGVWFFFFITVIWNNSVTFISFFFCLWLQLWVLKQVKVSTHCTIAKLFIWFVEILFVKQICVFLIIKNECFFYVWLEIPNFTHMWFSTKTSVNYLSLSELNCKMKSRTMWFSKILGTTWNSVNMDYISGTWYSHHYRSA